MSKIVDIRDAKDHLPELLALVEAGTEVILTEADTPRARLVPFVTAKARTAGLHPGSMEMYPDFDEPLSDEFWFGDA